ncbi:hypothetical protein PV08_11249 [Exophiala spinifera]|uniref:Heterokaryon incompatibility domain-containing protein n=1 Tax=Exophiala spinifera TaxID=91928 RepID=A0A0D1ZB84_9EURO|nr:uncharacterized protein PV08_11249 [Exophiala spinifera]KIW10287.1 hypothetical protein PV08_11249 [Exophiala spinifera]
MSENSHPMAGDEEDAVGQQNDTVSAYLATLFSITTCDEHEQCDSSCSGDPVLLQPLVSDRNRVHISTPPRPRIIDPDTQLRDRSWADSQQFLGLKYEPIDSKSGEIRLLKIKPGVFRADVVECEMFTTSLSSEEAFEAISYCCGVHNASELIICNGQAHLIYPSLNSAIKAYRSSGHVSRPVWVDAVSINQVDKQELKEQIPLMRAIYSRALQVFIYLGDFDNADYQGFDLMMKLSNVNLHQQKLYPQEQHKPVLPLEVLVQRYRLPPAGHQSYRNFVQLLSFPWYRRTWILQEVALSKQAEVHFGRLGIKWEVLANSAYFWVWSGLSRSADYGGDTVSRYSEISLARLLDVCKVAIRADQTSLMEILRHTRDFQVSDPRDKVIAILGMVGNMDQELASLADYELSADQIFHKTALYLIHRNWVHLLLAHSGLQRRPENDNNPSWVPNWTTDSRKYNERPLVLLRQAKEFRAGGRASLCPLTWLSDQDYPKELLVLGFASHRISWTGKACPFVAEGQMYPADFSYVGEFLHWYRKTRECLATVVQANVLQTVYDDVEEAFYRTLLVDDLYPPHPQLPNFSDIQDPKAECALAIEALLQMATTENPDAELGNIDRDQKMTSVDTCIMQLTTAPRGRRFAVTDTGYMCLTPEKTEIGDHVVLLHGFPTPFVVRSVTEERSTKDMKLTGTRSLDELMGSVMSLGASGAREAAQGWFLKEMLARGYDGMMKRKNVTLVGQLVGDVYVHGLMEGEAFPDAEADYTKMQAIMLI